MPRFNVQWEWSVEWVIEAESADALATAAIEYAESAQRDLLLLSDTLTTVYGQSPSSRDCNIEAVLVDGKLLSPEDKKAEEEWKRLIKEKEEKDIAEEIAKFEAKTGSLFDLDKQEEPPGK